MRLNELNKLLKDKPLLNKTLKRYEKIKVLRKQDKNEYEIKGHIEKAQNNLKFIQDNLKLGYFDWCITGCYYAVYHASLALIIAKGFFSKNHDATLCVLIKEYFNQGVNEEDIELISRLFLNYQDMLFYVQSKNKREEATYSSKYKFDKELVEKFKLKTIEFINKIKDILQ